MHALLPFEAVLDADMPQHVVGQRAQQPHRVHRIGQFASEFLHAAVGPRQQREIVVLILEIAAARADVDASAVVERRDRFRRQRFAVGDEAGVVDRAARRIEAEEVRAPYQLVQLAVLDHFTRVEMRDLTGHPCRPIRRIPLFDRRERRPARPHGSKDVRGTPSARAHRSGGGDDNARYAQSSPALTSTHVPAPHPSPSGLRRTMQLLEPPKPNELDMAIRTR